MGQVVPISPSELDALAADINEAINDAFDSILVICVKLARAKEVCREQGIDFKDWFPGRIALSRNLVYIYARIGEASNPGKALDAYRLAVSERVQRFRDTVSLRNDTQTEPKSRTYTQGEDDDEIDTDEYQAEAERLRCIRATLARAQDAIDYASDDILDGVELSEEESREVLTLARKAADLCTKYADTLERRYGS